MARPKSNYTQRELAEGKVFCAEIYAESDSYNTEITLSKLPCFFEKFYYCLHDSDVYSEEDLYKYQQNNNGANPEWKVGDKKKPHYHIVVTKSSNAQLGFIAKLLEIPSQFVQRCSNKKGAVQYLLHLNNTDKHQYSREELITNDDKVEKLLRRNEESNEKAEKLYSYIFTSETTTMTELAKYAIKNGMWDELRRGQHVFSQILFEKRSVICESKFVESQK